MTPGAGFAEAYPVALGARANLGGPGRREFPVGGFGVRITNGSPVRHGRPGFPRRLLHGTPAAPIGGWERVPLMGPHLGARNGARVGTSRRFRARSTDFRFERP